MTGWLAHLRTWQVRAGGGKTGSRAALPATVTARLDAKGLGLAKPKPNPNSNPSPNPDQVTARLDAKWAAQLAPATGCAGYAHPYPQPQP